MDLGSTDIVLPSNILYVDLMFAKELKYDSSCFEASLLDVCWYDTVRLKKSVSAA